MKLSTMIGFAAFGLIATVSVTLSERSGLADATPTATGINYLKTAQMADGSWGGLTTSLNDFLPSTATALIGLRTLESSMSTNQTLAIQYLNSQAIDETPLIAQR